MLEYLRIRNLALIEDMTLEFSNGINVLTGETGVGKSFIIKSIGFLLGDKLASDIVRTGAERAQVEALFIVDGKEIIIRRELHAESGRSRLYINDILASQDSLKELRNSLISHTSQHAQQQLLHSAFQTKMMESVFPDQSLLAKKDELLNRLQNLAKKKENLSERVSRLAEKRDLLEMQNEEIKKVSPQEGEEEELEKLRSRIREEKSNQQHYSQVQEILYGDNGYGLLDMLVDLEKLLSQMSKTNNSLLNDIEATSALRSQLLDLGRRIKYPDNSDHESMDMDKIEERLFNLAQLKRKLKRSLPEILSFQKEIEENLSFLDACALDEAQLNREIKSAEIELKEIVEKIKPVRHQSAMDFAKRLENQLRDLGFSEHLKVLPDFPENDIWPGIKDEKTRILWAPNPGQSPQPLDKIASGGELSRFLLAWISLRKDSDETTFIFDEVDAGIGGMTLNKVAEKIQSLSDKRQIILITHWPQLAAKAQKHFQIKKEIRQDKTFTLCEPITGKSRMQELARMAGGNEGKVLLQNLQE